VEAPGIHNRKSALAVPAATPYLAESGWFPVLVLTGLLYVSAAVLSSGFVKKETCSTPLNGSPVTKPSIRNGEPVVMVDDIVANVAPLPSRIRIPPVVRIWIPIHNWLTDTMFDRMERMRVMFVGRASNR
jgi:hypothetical protein